MSPWVRFILQKVGASLAGAHWQDVVNRVQLLADATLSGAEKRQAVKAFLLDSGCSLAGFLLNLIIEIAVAWLEAQGAITVKDAA